MSVAGSASRPFIRDVSERDAELLVRWWNAHDPSHRYSRRRGPRLWTVWRDDHGVRRNTDTGLRAGRRTFDAQPTADGALALARAYQRAGDNPSAYEVLNKAFHVLFYSPRFDIFRRSTASGDPDADRLAQAIVEVWAAGPIASDGDPRYMGKFFLNDLRDASPVVEAAMKRLLSDLAGHITTFWVAHGQEVLPPRFRPGARVADRVLVMQRRYHSSQRKPTWAPKLDDDGLIEDLGLRLRPEIMIRTRGREWPDFPDRAGVNGAVESMHEAAMRSVTEAFHDTRVEWHYLDRDMVRYTEVGAHLFPHITTFGDYLLSLDQGFMRSLAERFSASRIDD